MKKSLQQRFFALLAGRIMTRPLKKRGSPNDYQHMLKAHYQKLQREPGKHRAELSQANALLKALRTMATAG